MIRVFWHGVCRANKINIADDMLKFGIVSTIADAEDSVEAFIRYHRAIGFEYFYLFIDDNSLETIRSASKYENVYVFLKDEVLRSRWKEYLSKLSEEKINLIDKEVMVRQELNFYVGFHQAKQQGVDWVLHIDLDELFYTNGFQLDSYFANLQLENYRSVTLLNYESISTGVEADNIYLTSTYFRVNHFKNRHWFYTQEQKDFFKKNSWVTEKYFLYYQNGKSCVSTYGNSLDFYDVHSIMGAGKRRMGGHTDPIILHFPCARFSDFIKKYKRLGDFSDNWLGKKRVGDFIDQFHLDARDKAGYMTESQLSSFYLQYRCLQSSQIDDLCRLGLAKQVIDHIDILKRL